MLALLMQEFEIGDQVVYPNHGVGIIEKISNRLVQGKFQRFYLLRICSNDILVMVPTANANDVGLRRTIDGKESHAAFHVSLQQRILLPEGLERPF